MTREEFLYSERERVRAYRARKRQEELETRGKCPRCEFFLIAEWHQRFPCATTPTLYAFL